MPKTSGYRVGWILIALFLTACASFSGTSTSGGITSPSSTIPKVPACLNAVFVLPSSDQIGWTFRYPGYTDANGVFHYGGEYQDKPGYTQFSKIHTGVDFVGADGDPIVAVHAGIVTAVTSDSVEIHHTDLQVWTYYTHMEAVDVAANMQVVSGQLLGKMGHVNTSVTHLHFSVNNGQDERILANTVDPSPFFGANLNYDQGAMPYINQSLLGYCTQASGPLPTDTPSPLPPTLTPIPVGPHILYQADWSHGTDGWAGTPDWKASGGNFINDGTNSANLETSPSLVVPFSMANYSNFVVEAKIQVTNQGFDPGFDFFVRYTPPVQGYIIGVTDGYNASQPLSGVSITTANQFYSPLATANFTPTTGVQTYRVEVNGVHLRFLIDGNVYLDIMDGTTSSGMSVGLSDKDAAIVISSFIIYSN